MAILYAGNITAKQTGTLFNVTLGEFLCFAHFAKAVANNRGGIVTLRLLEGKQGVLVHKKPSETTRAVCKVRPTATPNLQRWFRRKNQESSPLDSSIRA